MDDMQAIRLSQLRFPGNLSRYRQVSIYDSAFADLLESTVQRGDVPQYPPPAVELTRDAPLSYAATIEYLESVAVQLDAKAVSVTVPELDEAGDPIIDTSGKPKTKKRPITGVLLRAWTAANIVEGDPEAVDIIAGNTRGLCDVLLCATIGAPQAMQADVVTFESHSERVICAVSENGLRGVGVSEFRPVDRVHAVWEMRTANGNHSPTQREIVGSGLAKNGSEAQRLLTLCRVLALDDSLRADIMRSLDVGPPDGYGIGKLTVPVMSSFLTDYGNASTGEKPGVIAGFKAALQQGRATKRLVSGDVATDAASPCEVVSTLAKDKYSDASARVKQTATRIRDNGATLDEVLDCIERPDVHGGAAIVASLTTRRAARMAEAAEATEPEQEQEQEQEQEHNAKGKRKGKKG